MPGHSDTTAPPLLDRQQTDLLEALPPVVTGVDVDNVFEGWQESSFQMKDAVRRREGVRKSTGCTGDNDHKGGGAAEDPVDGGRDVLARVDLSPAHNTAAGAAVVETRVPAVGAHLDGGSSNENLCTYSSVEEEDPAAGRAAAAAARSTVGVDAEENCSDGGLKMQAATGLPKAEEGAAAAAAEAGNTTPGYLDAYVPPSGVGLTRLCRRAVILLTRSPACPDLVAWQIHPAEQRTYDQMEPLLARANMSHRDLHPRPVGLPQSCHATP